MITETEEEYKSDAGSTNDTPHLSLTGELWGVFYGYLRENWPRYNGTALYVLLVTMHHGTAQYSYSLSGP